MIELSSKIPIAELSVIVLRIVAKNYGLNSIRIPIADEFDIDLLNAVLAEYGGSVRFNETAYCELGFKMWNEIVVCPEDFDATHLSKFEMWDNNKKWSDEN